MNRTLAFDSPYLLGFEHTRLLIERVAKAAAESYPPYNVEDLSGSRVRISLAVAGFSANQLQITVEVDLLQIAGSRDAEGQPEASAERAYFHRGIAARSFVRTFIMAGGMEVEAASLELGLLHIDLYRPDAVQLIKRIPITTAS